MKKIKKSTGLTLALLIYVSATAAYFLPRNTEISDTEKYVTVAASYLIVFVGIQRVCTRDKLVAIHLDRMLGRNRDHEDEYHRDNAGQGKDHKNNIENCICRSLDLI